MICIKNRNFLNKIDVTTKTLNTNKERNIPIHSSQDSMNDENEISNQERPNNPALKDKDKKFQKALVHFQTNSSDTESCSVDIIQDQTNNLEAHEVIQILLYFTLEMISKIKYNIYAW